MMTNKKIGNQIAREVEKEILSDLNDLEKAMGDNSEMPEELDIRLKNIMEKESVQSSTKRRFPLKRAASFLIGLFGLTTMISITMPEVVPAIKNVLNILVSYTTGQSTDISIDNSLSSMWSDIEQAIPNGYIKSMPVACRNVERLTFENDKNYISISIYNKDFMLSLDSEKYTDYQEYQANQQNCRLITKNEITVIVFLYQGRILEMASDLPVDDVKAIAEKLLLENV